MDDKKKTIAQIDNEIKKDNKSSKDSLAKEILHDEYDYHVNPKEAQHGRDSVNEQDHHEKRTSGVKKGFCDNNKCDISFD